jgi:tripartite-type tricarboxylate transporter receptor subunit TctC
MKHLLRALSLLSMMVVSSPLMAQAYPTKPIRVIVGFPVGTLVDVIGRALGVHMQKQLGQPIIVEARPGAGGFIGASAVMTADPDGHTLHFGVLGGLIPALVKNNPVDARKDFAPVSDALSSPFFLFSSAKLPVHNLQDLITYSKANPGKLNFGSSTGQVEIMMQLVRNSTGITYTLINYPGAPAVIPGMITGDVGIHINVLGPFIPHMDAGTIRALFMSGPKRMAQFPNIPTATEAGVPNVEAAAFDIGYWAPRATPRPVIDKVVQSVISAVQMPDVLDLFRKQGYIAVGSTPEEQMRKYEASLKFWTDTARLTNFQPQ